MIPMEKTRIPVKHINADVNKIVRLLSNNENDRTIKANNKINKTNGKKILKGLKKAETERINPKVRRESLMIFTLVTPFLPKYWIGS